MYIPQPQEVGLPDVKDVVEISCLAGHRSVGALRDQIYDVAFSLTGKLLYYSFGCADFELTPSHHMPSPRMREVLLAPLYAVWETALDFEFAAIFVFLPHSSSQYQ